MDVVAAGGWEAGSVFLKVGPIDGVSAETCRQFKADPFDATDQVVSFVVGQVRPVGEPCLRAFFKDVDIEGRLVGMVFARRVAPTAPCVAHFNVDALVAQCVEVEQCSGMRSGVIEP